LWWWQLRDLVTAADAGTAVSRSRITVSQFPTDWLASIKPQVRETTWVSYWMAVGRLVVRDVSCAGC
jgi:hypothetical protein